MVFFIVITYRFIIAQYKRISISGVYKREQDYTMMNLWTDVLVTSRTIWD